MQCVTGSVLNVETVRTAVSTLAPRRMREPAPRNQTKQIDQQPARLDTCVRARALLPNHMNSCTFVRHLAGKRHVYAHVRL